MGSTSCVFSIRDSRNLEGRSVSFAFVPAAVPGLVIVQPRVFPDDRGFFMESYKESDFLRAGIAAHFVQDNHSCSAQGVLRGLHYQLPPYAQGKLARVIEGSVWDVAVDIRMDSPTFGKWYGIELSAGDHQMLYIPSGFAHGFVALTEHTQFLYKCTAEYCKESETGIRWNDPAIGIQWPVANPIVSERDQSLPLLSGATLFPSAGQT